MLVTTAPLLARDAAILRYLARYRIGLRSVLGDLFFDGKEDAAGRVLGILAKRGLVTVHSRSLKNNVSYVTLTAAGYAALGIKINKRACAAIGPGAVAKAIAMACGSTSGTHRRQRLMRSELMTAYASDAPPDNVFHVASDELGWPAIFRVVFATSVDQRQIERLKRHADEAKKNAAIRPWLDAGDYGFFVLVPWNDKLATMRTLIEASPLAKHYVFIVDVGPTVDTLSQFLGKDSKR